MEADKNIGTEGSGARGEEQNILMSGEVWAGEVCVCVCVWRRGGGGWQSILDVWRVEEGRSEEYPRRQENGEGGGEMSFLSRELWEKGRGRTSVRAFSFLSFFFFFSFFLLLFLKRGSTPVPEMTWHFLHSAGDGLLIVDL